VSGDVETALSGLLRDEWPRLVVAGMRILDDLQAAEDVAQETLLAALDNWPLSGVPDRPGGWLMTVSKRSLERFLQMLRNRAPCFAQ